jgi:hypothetical protein
MVQNEGLRHLLRPIRNKAIPAGARHYIALFRRVLKCFRDRRLGLQRSLEREGALDAVGFALFGDDAQRFDHLFRQVLRRNRKNIFD